MRLLKVSAPAGFGEKLRATAFSAGIDSVSIHQTIKFKSSGERTDLDVVNIEASTPVAKKFLDRLLSEDYYEPDRVSFEIREARSLVKDRDLRALTIPLVVPASDLCEELWQFSHITYGLIGRVFISACLLAYGMIEDRMLIIVSGLLFLPILPMILAIGFGVVGGQKRLAFAGVKALVLSLFVIFAGSMVVAAICREPLRFHEFAPPLTGVIISMAVGVAATLAAIDDAGRRELIGLAAASQIGIVPAWLAISLVNGLSSSGTSDAITKVGSLFLNILALVFAIMVLQFATGAVGEIRRIK